MANAMPIAEDRSDDATSHDVAMPRLSRTLDRAAIVRWFVEPGQVVTEGDVLAELAAEAVSMELEATASGALHVLAPAGPEPLLAGQIIARISPVRDAGGREEAPSAPAERAHELERPPVEPGAGQATTEMTYAEALRAGLAAAMRRDAAVFVIGESVADFGRCSSAVKGLAEEFGPQRVVGTPITPAAFTGLAVGAAMAGLKPVVEVTAWALALQAMDPIVSSAAKTRYRSGGQIGVSLLLRGRNGRWPGAGAMHSMSLAAWLASVPGLKVVCPATPSCAKGLIAAALADPDPVIMLEPDALYDAAGDVPDDDGWRVPIGVARLARPGHDLTIVTYGEGVLTALAAAVQLAEHGVEAEVIDLRTLRPLDMATVLGSVRKTGRLLVLDDGGPVCSLAAEICAAVATAEFAALRAAPVRMEAADVPMPYAPNLEALVPRDADEVAAKALRLVRQASV
jgi:pyruvate dehydrogenase E1 component beta subunit